MRRNIWNWLGVFALIALVALLVAVAAHADPLAPTTTGAYITGSVAFDTPVISRPDRTVDRSTAFHGCLQLHNAIGPLALNLGGDYQFRPGHAYLGENKFFLGIDAPLGGGLTPYLNFERRYDVNDNRVVAGVRWSFDSRN